MLRGSRECDGEWAGEGYGEWEASQPILINDRSYTRFSIHMPVTLRGPLPGL